jgi:hypothetical protein
VAPGGVSQPWFSLLLVVHPNMRRRTCSVLDDSHGLPALTAETLNSSESQSPGSPLEKTSLYYGALASIRN